MFYISDKFSGGDSGNLDEASLNLSGDLGARVIVKSDPPMICRCKGSGLFYQVGKIKVIGSEDYAPACWGITETGFGLHFSESVKIYKSHMYGGVNCGHYYYLPSSCSENEAPVDNCEEYKKLVLKREKCDEKDKNTSAGSNSYFKIVNTEDKYLTDSPLIDKPYIYCRCLASMNTYRVQKIEHCDRVNGQ